MTQVDQNILFLMMSLCAENEKTELFYIASTKREERMAFEQATHIATSLFPKIFRKRFHHSDRSSIEFSNLSSINFYAEDIFLSQSRSNSFLHPKIDEIYAADDTKYIIRSSKLNKIALLLFDLADKHSATGFEPHYMGRLARINYDASKRYEHLQSIEQEREDASQKELENMWEKCIFEGVKESGVSSAKD